MNPPSPQFFAITAIIVEIVVWIFVSYARLILCHWCHAPFAVHERVCGDLCRSCAKVFDDHRAKIGRRRTILQRIRRSAA